MKNSSDTIGNRTLDLTSFSAMPRTTASPGSVTLTDTYYIQTSNTDIMQIFMNKLHEFFYVTKQTIWT